MSSSTNTLPSVQSWKLLSTQMKFVILICKIPHDCMHMKRQGKCFIWPCIFWFLPKHHRIPVGGQTKWLRTVQKENKLALMHYLLLFWFVIKSRTNMHRKTGKKRPSRFPDELCVRLFSACVCGSLALECSFLRSSFCFACTEYEIFE